MKSATVPTVFIVDDDRGMRQAIQDLNNLLPKDSPLLLLFAGGINDRAEITGEACVIANGVCTTDQPRFLGHSGR